MSDQGNLMQTSGWTQFFHHLDRVERPLCTLANALALQINQELYEEIRLGLDCSNIYNLGFK